MPAHDQILDAALRLCRARGDWQFRLEEVVKALPHIPAGTVRTHVVSRCCTNAPANHPHRWDYFTRVGRGTYEIREPYRLRRKAKPAVRAVREGRAVYSADASSRPRDTVHAVISQSHGWFVAECLEIPVVTQGRTLDETVDNLGQAVDLYLEGEDAARLGLVPEPRLSVTYEPPRRPA